MNEIQTQNQDLFPITESKYGNDKVHDLIAAGGSFLPRVQLVAAGAQLAKKKLAEAGTYVVVRGANKVDHKLGEEFSCMLLGWRPKAIRFLPDNKLQCFYNPYHEGFKAVEFGADKKDSGCMFGPEYLIYIPPVDAICCFHFNNLTMRMSAGPMKANMGKNVTCRIELIEKGQFSWYGPVITTCSTPFALPEVGSPERTALSERLKAAQDAFNNPKEVEETVEEAAPDAPADNRPR